MEDITTIKQQTFELRQYASAIMNDIDNMIAEERKEYKDSIDKIDNLNETLLAQSDEIKKLKDENTKLATTIKSMKRVIGSALEICEGAE